MIILIWSHLTGLGWKADEWHTLRRPKLVAVFKFGSVIFFYFSICKIHGIPGVFMCRKLYLTVIEVKQVRSQTKICVLCAFFVKYIYTWKNATFSIKFFKKNTKTWNFDKLINDICMGIIFIFCREKWEGGGSSLKF